MDTITWVAIVLRILTAMTVGALVGGQRARTAHPAGLRTHMLVTLGACVVMITGSLLYQDTHLLYGSAPDPARMGAQVISGIGFLGAGTILKDGSSVRGLTTAASLWTVACLGLAAGLGYYLLSFIGGGALFITLTVFDKVQYHMRHGKRPELEIRLECENTGVIMVELESLAKQYLAAFSELSFRRTKSNTYLVSFIINFPTQDWLIVQSEFLQKLAGIQGVVSMENRP